MDATATDAGQGLGIARRKGKSDQIKNVSVVSIVIESLQNRLLKVCYVPSTRASLPRLFLLRPLTVLMKQTSAGSIK
jgi:hypothetical protein